MKATNNDHIINLMVYYSKSDQGQSSIFTESIQNGERFLRLSVVWFDIISIKR